MEKKQRLEPLRSSQPDAPLPRSVQIAFVFALNEELRQAAQVLGVAIPKCDGNVQRTLERNALARLLRLAREGGQRERMHACNRAYDEESYLAQIADLNSAIDRLDVDGEYRKAWPPITVMGDFPVDVESDPAMAEIARLFAKRKAALAVAERIGVNAISGKGIREGNELSTRLRAGKSNARGKKMHDELAARFPNGIPAMGSPTRRQAVQAIARANHVSERTARDAIGKVERNLAG